MTPRQALERRVFAISAELGSALPEHFSQRQAPVAAVRLLQTSDLALAILNPEASSVPEIKVLPGYLISYDSYSFLSNLLRHHSPALRKCKPLPRAEANCISPRSRIRPGVRVDARSVLLCGL